MVYLITSILTKPDGHVCFDPVTDTEVFPSYISALRWLVSERKSVVRLGWKVWTIIPNYRNSLGRETMFHLCYQSPFGAIYRLQVSRISTDGWH